jgi:hypothetical protein
MFRIIGTGQPSVLVLSRNGLSVEQGKLAIKYSWVRRSEPAAVLSVCILISTLELLFLSIYANKIFSFVTFIIFG